MLEKVKYQKLFSTPLFRFHFPEFAELNQALLAEGAAMRGESEGVTKSNRGGWHSKGNLFSRKAPCIKILEALAGEAVAKSTSDIGSKADFDSLDLKLFGWMNANPTGGLNAPHTHPGAHWSGVYYVAQPEIEEGNSGMIEFLDPRTDLPHWRILDAPPFRTRKKFRPKPGNLVIFPSYLVHWVYPNESDQERITIAFNATLSKSSES